MDLHFPAEHHAVLLDGIPNYHAQVAPAHKPPLAGDMCATINAGLMKELGYTVMVKDENGNDTKEVDWGKTRAVQQQGNDIFINLKGKNGGRGIVDPADQYELEEQIMTDLYGYKSPETPALIVAHISPASGGLWAGATWAWSEVTIIVQPSSR